MSRVRPRAARGGRRRARSAPRRLRVVATARAGAPHGARRSRRTSRSPARGSSGGRRGGSGRVPAESLSGGVTAALDRATDTIRITAGTGITLERLSKAVGNSAALRELQPSERMVGANIEIDRGASLTLSAPDVSWVKLHSVGPTYATVKAFGGASGRSTGSASRPGTTRSSRSTRTRRTGAASCSPAMAAR